MKKVWRENNKERISEWGKDYRIKNIDDITKYQKRYYEQNKDKLNEQRKQKVICNRCGFEVKKNSLPRHKRSLKCINFKPS